MRSFSRIYNNITLYKKVVLRKITLHKTVALHKITLHKKVALRKIAPTDIYNTVFLGYNLHRKWYRGFAKRADRIGTDPLY